MPQTQVNLEAALFSPSSLIELWTLNGTNIGLPTAYYFVNVSDASFTPIMFNNVVYTPFPIKVEGMAYDGKGSIPRPKLTVSNINGFVSNLLLQNQQLNGAVVTRQRVYARYLDASNFQLPTPNWVTPDSTATYAPEPWVINRKVIENQQIVQFELTSPIELQNVKLPRRQLIANVCSWFFRRQNQCQYVGAPVADNANRTFTGFYGMTLTDKGAYDSGTTYSRGDYVYTYSLLPQFGDTKLVWVCAVNGTVGTTPSSSSAAWIMDACPHTMAGCALHFPNQPLRGSFFPGISRAGWVSRA